MSKLEINSQEDSWRLRCPNGHKLAPVNNHWYCRQCARYWDDDVDPEYEIAVDEKTGDELTRDEVKLNFDAPGVYYA